MVGGGGPLPRAHHRGDEDGAAATSADTSRGRTTLVRPGVVTHERSAASVRAPAVGLDEQQLVGIGKVEADARAVGQLHRVLVNRPGTPAACSTWRKRVSSSLSVGGSDGPALEHPPQCGGPGRPGRDSWPRRHRSRGTLVRRLRSADSSARSNTPSSVTAPRSIRVRLASVQGMPWRSTTSKSARSSLRCTTPDEGTRRGERSPRPGQPRSSRVPTAVRRPGGRPRLRGRCTPEAPAVRSGPPGTSAGGWRVVLPPEPTRRC